MGMKKKKGLRHLHVMVFVASRLAHHLLADAEKVVAALQISASELAPQRVISQIGGTVGVGHHIRLAVGLAGLVAQNIVVCSRALHTVVRDDCLSSVDVRNGCHQSNQKKNKLHD